MRIFSFLMILFLGQQVFGFDHSHQKLTQILKANVIVKKGGRFSQLDYKGVDRELLKTYTKASLQVSKETVDSWSKARQLAFYFNLYNALTIELILDHYPLKSIRDIKGGLFGGSPWKKRFFRLFGKRSHLDEVEHKLTRGNPKIFDPLLHFAFNCASIGCPALLNQAFEGERLENQLQTATKNFLRDRSRNYIEGNNVYVSKIFSWYGGDFQKGVRGFKSLKDFFYYYRDSLADNPKQLGLLKSRKYTIKFPEYDWNLNDKS